jgi:hypothetical protein
MERVMGMIRVRVRVSSKLLLNAPCGRLGFFGLGKGLGLGLRNG